MRARLLSGFLVLASILLVVVAAGGVSLGCTSVAETEVEAGWNLYRRGWIEQAEARFDSALRRCPDHREALLGRGHTRLRLNDAKGAEALFERLLRDDPDHVDALVGLGTAAETLSDYRTAYDALARAIQLAPERTDAATVLARIPEGWAPGPPRPLLRLPDSTVVRARTSGDRFEVRTPGGWTPFHVKGVNLGAALPGRWPSQFPDSATYASWIRQVGEMGANALRVYTIHPPSFYAALLDHNRAHPDRPIWLIHGVWTELPPGHDYEHPAWQEEFFQEMRRVVDVLHGRADLVPRSGHASGYYVADVSPWTLAFVIGREWEPYSVLSFDASRPSPTSFRGRYLAVEEGSPMEGWLTRAMETMVDYEMRRYNEQRPIAFTSWPTLDPLHHPTEATLAEERRIAASFGEAVYVPQGSEEHDEDAVSVDPMRIQATDAFPAGHFAVYHAYPYYPDFAVLDPSYAAARSPWGPSAYYGYLEDLKRHHQGMPVVIGEYGVPASLGIAHLQPNGWHHGGHTEAAMAETTARLTREIAAAGMAGGMVFAWIDEWFKRNWLTAEYHLPADRNRLWLDRMDAEQQYGILAMEPVGPLPSGRIADRLPAWDTVPPLYGTPGEGCLRAAADEAYLWLLFTCADRSPEAEVLIGFDILDPAAGGFRWPGGRGPALAAGAEFVLGVGPEGARLRAHPSVNPFRVVEIVGDSARPDPVAPSLEGEPPGLFSGRLGRAANLRPLPQPSRDGVWEPLRVLTQGRRFGRDSTEYAALGYDRGVLRNGPPPDGLWERIPDWGMVEVRIPWLLLNVTDPSSRSVLGLASRAGRGWMPVTVDDIGIVAATRAADGSWRSWPEPETGARPARFAWSGWEEPRWRERRRPIFDELRRVFGELDSVPLAGGEEP